MADSLAQAWVEVLPDFKEFRNKANSEMSSALGSAGNAGGLSASRGIQGGLATTFKGNFLANLATDALQDIGRAIGVAIGTSINYGLDSIDLASSLNESFNANKVTFGPEIAKQLEVLGADAATRLGLTQKAFNELSTRFSSFAQTIRSEDVAGFIDELTVRGADFASVYNLEVNDALELFQSGLAGETEPLRKFGLDLSAASVSAYAYANGIGTVGVELTEQEKVQARYGLLLEQTTKVQGDNANTAGELAGQQRRLAASFEEAQTKLGTALLPAMTALAVLANDELVPILNEVIAEVGPVLAEALKESVPAFQELVTAIAPLIPDLVTLAVEALPSVIQSIILLSPLLIDWANNSAFVFSMMDDLFALLNGDTSLADIGAKVLAFGGSLAAVTIGLGKFSADISTNFARFSADVQTNVGLAVSFITGLPGAAVAALGNLGSTLYGSGKALLQGFVDGIKAMLKPVGDAVSNVLSFAKGFFPRSPAERGPFSGAGWTAVAKSGEAIMDQFASGLFGPDLSLAMGSVSLPSFAGSSSAVAPSANGAVASSAGFTNNGTIITQDVPAFFAEKAKSDRRALALEGIDGSLVA